MVALNDAYLKLASLSEDRARRVVALIQDLAELEAVENAQDLADAREALEEIKAGEKPASWSKVKAELDALHDRNQ